jgi:hypothetical protein
MNPLQSPFGLRSAALSLSLVRYPETTMARAEARHILVPTESQAQDLKQQI